MFALPPLPRSAEKGLRAQRSGNNGAELAPTEGGRTLSAITSLGLGRAINSRAIAAALTIAVALLAAPTADAIERHATPSNLTTVFSNARANDTILLASGDYGTFRGGVKSGMVTLAPEPGAHVTMGAELQSRREHHDQRREADRRGDHRRQYARHHDPQLKCARPGVDRYPRGPRRSRHPGKRRLSRLGHVLELRRGAGLSHRRLPAIGGGDPRLEVLRRALGRDPERLLRDEDHPQRSFTTSPRAVPRARTPTRSSSTARATP